MVATRKCLRCGHEWSQRAGAKPKTCPKCRSPYWNRQRREEMSPLADLEYALEERKHMELELQQRRKKIDMELTDKMVQIEQLQEEMASVMSNLEALQGLPERTEEQEAQLSRLKDKRSSLASNLNCLAQESERMESMLHTLEPVTGRSDEVLIDCDLLLEALDDDAENEIYAEGARRYARRLAERIRDGEFDGD